MAKLPNISFNHEVYKIENLYEVYALKLEFNNQNNKCNNALFIPILKYDLFNNFFLNHFYPVANFGEVFHQYIQIKF